MDPERASPSEVVLLENPDGTLATGVPPGFKDVTPPLSPRARDVGQMLLGTTQYSSQELVDLYEKHIKLFAMLLSSQLVLEAIFQALYFLRREVEMQRVHAIYGAATMPVIRHVFLTAFGIECAYMVVYYSIAVLAWSSRRPRHFKLFANCCLAGVVGHIFLAYLNKFNLLIFFLRLFAFGHSKFLRHVGQLLLLNRGPPMGALAGA
mmetsp:Transcript_28273/g.64208  ORF Transcript_28273/g.64208 Transcript_28273/m.64208 type:complete len:207 (+) Transcript_28273:104-724(+)